MNQPVPIPPSPLRRVGRVALAALAVLVVLAGVLVAYTRWGHCGDGVEEAGPRDECVGITDGGYVFHDELRDVQQKILAENKWVLDQDVPYVNMAYFTPMTLVDNDVTTYRSVQHSLRGAYLSQYRANHTNGWAGTSPLVRLLMANPGSRAEQWEPVVDAIERRREDDEDRIAAVAGMGQSLGSTIAAARRLSELGVPMVGSIITADGFGEIDGLVRVVPSNTDEVSAIVEHLGDTERAMLVRDTNTSDDFATNLGALFEEKYPQDGRVLVQPIEEFVSSDDTGGNKFQGIAPEICVARPDVIFFAGRFRDLTLFMAVLADRPCRELSLRIITGDSVVDLAADESIASALRTGITLEYLRLADPQAWTESGADELFGSEAVRVFTATEGAGTFLGEFANPEPDRVTQQQWLDAALGDGLSMLSFDAVGTAVSGLRTEGGFPRLHGLSSVRGASGLISLDGSDPDRKVISLLTLTAGTDGGTAIARTLTSCTGEPFRVRTFDSADPVPCQG